MLIIKELKRYVFLIFKYDIVIKSMGYSNMQPSHVLKVLTVNCNAPGYNKMFNIIKIKVAYKIYNVYFVIKELILWSVKVVEKKWKCTHLSRSIMIILEKTCNFLVNVLHNIAYNLTVCYYTTCILFGSRSTFELLLIKRIFLNV